MASAGCTKKAGEPVEASVAAIFEPIWPLLPMPVTMIRPLICDRISTQRKNGSDRPFWSASPFEMMIIPRSHDLHLTDSNDATLAGMGIAIRDAIRHLREAVGDVSFNLVLRTAPHHYTGAFHWYVSIWPKLFTTAGFERGTGVMINIVPPESAASHLRDVAVHA